MEGYKFKTTFWNDFTIAEKFGNNSIIDTFNRAFNEWKDDYIYLTELVLVLNWKIWQYWEEGNDNLAKLYDSLWRKADAYGVNTLKDDELAYFIETLD